MESQSWWPWRRDNRETRPPAAESPIDPLTKPRSVAEIRRALHETATALMDKEWQGTADGQELTPEVRQSLIASCGAYLGDLFQALERHETQAGSEVANYFSLREAAIQPRNKVLDEVVEGETYYDPDMMDAAFIRSIRDIVDNQFRDIVNPPPSAENHGLPHGQ